MSVCCCLSTAAINSVCVETVCCCCCVCVAAFLVPCDMLAFAFVVHGSAVLRRRAATKDRRKHEELKEEKNDLVFPQHGIFGPCDFV